MLDSLFHVLLSGLLYYKGGGTQTKKTPQKGQGLRMVCVSGMYFHVCVRIWMKIGCTFILSLPALFSHFPA